MMVGLMQKGSNKEVTLRQKTLRLLRYKLRKIRKDAKMDNNRSAKFWNI